MYDKIDNKDITLQVESERIDVAVPQGKAMLKRAYDPNGITFMTDRGFSFHEDSRYEKVGVEDQFFPNKVAAFMYDMSVSANSNVNQSTTNVMSSNGSGTTRVLTDVNVNTSASSSTSTAVNIGPILAQSRVPMAVSEGMRINMTGGARVKRTGSAEKDDDGNSTSVYVEFSLWGVGTFIDEYGVETDNIIELQWWNSLLQNSETSTNVDFTIPKLADAVIPANISEIYFTIALKNDEGEWHTGNFKTTGWWRARQVKYLTFFDANPIKVFIKDAEGADLVEANVKSLTGAAFKNRRFFSNLYPLYGNDLLTNGSFTNDLIDWINTGGVVSTEDSHVASKSIKFTNALNMNHNLVVSATQGDSFYMSTWFKNISFAGSGGIRLQRRKISDGTWADLGIGDYPAVGSGWQKKEISITIPSDTNAVRARVAFSGTGTGFVDDVELRKGTHDNKMALIGGTMPVTVNIYSWSGTRGPLITAVSLAANERKLIDISSATGAIELSNPSFVQAVPSGIIKNGTQPIVLKTWTKVTNFNIASGFPGTIISSDSIQVQYAGTVDITGFIRMTADASGIRANSRGFRVLQNGAVIGTYIKSEKSLLSVTGKVSAVTVAVGDIISFEGYLEKSTYDFGGTTRAIDPSTNFKLEYVASVTQNYFIEQVYPNKYETMTEYQNHMHALSFIDVIDEVSNIKIERSEADASILSISFSSSLLDPTIANVLAVGKVIRVLGRHYGAGNTQKPSGWSGEANYTKIMTATVKRIETIYNYIDDPQIKITATDAYDRLDKTTPGVAYEQISEYYPLLNVTGVETIANDLDVTGVSGNLPEGFEYFPSTHGEFTLMDSLIMNRNALKSFLYIDRDNKLILTSSIPSDSKLTITDGTGAGDISMSSIKQGADTDTVLNKIDVEENLLDRKDFLEERDLNSEDPPQKFGPIKSLTRTISYKDQPSIDKYGEFSKKFQVVRGSGKWSDIIADNYGTSFKTWAEGLMTNYSQANIRISEINIPVKDSNDIRLVSALEILDKITLIYKGVTYTMRIKQIKHDIVPGRWTTTLVTAPDADQTYWGV